MDKMQAIEILLSERFCASNTAGAREKLQAYDMALDSLKGIRSKPDKLDDKKEICKALVPVLQMTRNLYDLVDLEYVGDGIEVVIATFESGYKKSANVSMDSGTSMIRDIIRQIV